MHSRRFVAITFALSLSIGASGNAARVTLPEPAADERATGSAGAATLVLAGGCISGFRVQGSGFRMQVLNRGMA